MLPFTIADAGLNPSIYNDLIVWEDWRNGNGDIYAYNLSTGEEKQVTRESSDQGNPVIYENYVAYLDDREGSPQVWMINLDTGQESQLTEGEWAKEDLAIADDLIVYVDRTDFESNIRIASLSGQCIESLQLPGAGSQHHPCLNDGRLVYDSNSGGVSDIYLYTFGTGERQFSASFYVNITQGSPPLTVQFTDDSVGDPTRLLWDFGDGNISHEENPVHCYLESGIYTVTYWINDPAHRDAVRKDNQIVVGTSPDARISADHEYGPMPFTVQFSDISTGFPDTWIWDFGDGTNDSVQNPVHTYQTSGTYNVTLLVGNTFGSNRPQFRSRSILCLARRNRSI